MHRALLVTLSLCHKHFDSRHFNLYTFIPPSFLRYTQYCESRLCSPLSSVIVTFLSHSLLPFQSLIHINSVTCLIHLSHYNHYNRVSLLPPLVLLSNYITFCFSFLEASSAYHPSTNNWRYTLEQSHFPQITVVELLMVILGSLQVLVCACVLVLSCPTIWNCNSFTVFPILYRKLPIMCDVLWNTGH